MDELWQIGLSGWILQDGNYPDFCVGDRADFALEFWSEDLQPATDLPMSVSPLADNRYDVVGTLATGSKIPVLDLGGVQAYSEHRRLPDGLTGLVAGQVSLSVDPFEYMDFHGRDRRNPPLIYGWRIEGITVKTGPTITVHPGDPRYRWHDEGPIRIRDPERIVWRPLTRTRMWDDEPDSIASYVVTCRLVDPEPKRTRFHLGPTDPAVARRHLHAYWPEGRDEALRDALVAAYAEPHRGYHDLLHLEEVLINVRGLGGDESTMLAAWFHDAVYEGVADDEERSARWAGQALADEPELAAEVARLVRLTATHRPGTGDRRGQLLCDADLAILGSEPDRYAEYVAGVRRDFAHVADADFRADRRAILEDLLAKEHLFETPEGRRHWEEAARANLNREIAELS